MGTQYVSAWHHGHHGHHGGYASAMSSGGSSMSSSGGMSSGSSSGVGQRYRILAHKHHFLCLKHRTCVKDANMYSLALDICKLNTVQSYGR